MGRALGCFACIACGFCPPKNSCRANDNLFSLRDRYAHVVVFTTSPSKTEDALRLGAHEVVLPHNADEMKTHASSFDFILDAVASPHDINAYINLLARDGNITMVGGPDDLDRFHS